MRFTAPSSIVQTVGAPCCRGPCRLIEPVAGLCSTVHGRGTKQTPIPEFIRERRPYIR